MAEAPARAVKPPDDPNVARLVQVLAIARSSKLNVTAIAVGDIRLVLAAPPDEKAPTRTLSAEEEKLAKLRARGRQLFGKDLPDQELLAMEGSL